MTSQVVTLLSKILVDGSVAFVDEQNTIWEPTQMTLDTSINPKIINHLTLSQEIVDTDLPRLKLAVYICASLFCILIGGITSGLNVSLLSVDEQKLDLQIRMEKNRLKQEMKHNSMHIRENEMLSDSPPNDNDSDIDIDSSQLRSERIEMCEKLKALIKDHHLLLVTILLGNASAMEALPIFLDDLVAPWFAVVISVTFVLIFGEIIPQALFSSEPILVGSKLSGLVRGFQIVLFPIAKPIAWLLDQCIPVHRVTYYTPNEIEAMIQNAHFGHPDQKILISGAFKLENLTVEDAAIPWKDVIRFPANMRLDEKGLRTLHASGCSRVPVYGEEREENIIGLCLVKNLIPVRPSSNVKLIDKSKSIPLVVSKDMNLLDCLNLFQAQKCHFALVPNNNNDVPRVQSCCGKHKNIPDDITFFGIITLEDVIEEVIQEEIYDETDSPANIDVDVDVNADGGNESINLDNSNNSNNNKSININIARGDYDHLCEISDSKDFIDIMKQRHIQQRRRLSRLKHNANKVKNKGYRVDRGYDGTGGESLIKRIASNRLIASADNVVEYNRVYDEIKHDNMNESDGYDTGQEFDYRARNSTDVGSNDGYIRYSLS